MKSVFSCRLPVFKLIDKVFYSMSGLTGLLDVLIDFASVSYNRDIDKSPPIIYGIDYPIVTNANSPKRILTRKLFTPNRSRI